MLKNKKPVKTFTLSVYGDPTYVVCPGHVGVVTFNRACKVEGWDMRYVEADLKYIYGFKTDKKRDGSFAFVTCSPELANAKKFTIVNWD